MNIRCNTQVTQWNQICDDDSCIEIILLSIAYNFRYIHWINLQVNHCCSFIHHVQNFRSQFSNAFIASNFKQSILHIHAICIACMYANCEFYLCKEICDVFCCLIFWAFSFYFMLSSTSTCVLKYETDVVYYYLYGLYAVKFDIIFTSDRVPKNDRNDT